MVAQLASMGHAQWQFGDLEYRRSVELPAYGVARTEAPVILYLNDWGDVDLSSIRVAETTGAPMEVTASAFAQPADIEPRLYFSAPGTTAANATRTFDIYYNRTGAGISYGFDYDRAGSTYGTREVVSSGKVFPSPA